MNKNFAIKILGMGATVIGMVATLLSDWVNDQKMNQRIEEKINEALDKKENEES